MNAALTLPSMPAKMWSAVRSSGAANAAPARQHPGMLEKLQRLVDKDVEVVHIGVCPGHKGDEPHCPYMHQNADWLEAHGIHVHWGTH